ncbi:hypothetical protein PANT111_150102 [Pantoea brenneri]|uniref:Uncharacterized protein n=1 Tax=Pantoea brenneri TaxID=472694 RepID=A0AAX3J3F9_9GAMM|nr:hypothetical protein PANT111_150102 [Pantoea brenneri]
MRQFVRHHVDCDGKTIKNLAVTITKYHLLTVPEGVLVFIAVMDRSEQFQPLIIQRVALVGLPEKVIGGAEIIPGFTGCDITVFGLAFLTNPLTGQGLLVLRIINFAIHMAACCRFRHGRLLPVFSHQMLYMGQGAARLFLLVTGAVRDNFAEDIGRNNAKGHVKLLGNRDVPKSIDRSVKIHLVDAITSDTITGVLTV